MVIDQSQQQTPIVMSEVTDPAELATARPRRERFNRNLAWFEAHATEIYRTHRGKVICVAGQELFVADDAAAVLALARTAHPDDDGCFTRIIPKEKLDRIYAY